MDKSVMVQRISKHLAYLDPQSELCVARATDDRILGVLAEVFLDLLDREIVHIRIDREVDGAKKDMQDIADRLRDAANDIESAANNL